MCVHMETLCAHKNVYIFDKRYITHTQDVHLTLQCTHTHIHTQTLEDQAISYVYINLP